MTFSSPSDFMPFICLWDLLNSHFQTHLLPVPSLCASEPREVLKEVKYSHKAPAALEDIIMQPRREAEAWRLVQSLLQGVLSQQP